MKTNQVVIWGGLGFAAYAIYMLTQPVRKGEEAIAKIFNTAVSAGATIHDDVTGGTKTVYTDTTGATSTVYRDVTGAIIYVWQEDIQGAVREVWSKFWAWTPW